jgi:hypothetical protein
MDPTTATQLAYLLRYGHVSLHEAREMEPEDRRALCEALGRLVETENRGRAAPVLGIGLTAEEVRKALADQAGRKRRDEDVERLVRGRSPEQLRHLCDALSRMIGAAEGGASALGLTCDEAEDAMSRALSGSDASATPRASEPPPEAR